MSRSDVEEIKRNARVLHVYQAYLNLKKDGQEYVVVCPFHQEKTGSFRLSLHDGVWVYKCFGCGKAGDIIKFVQEVDNIPFTGAVEKLTKEFGGSFKETKKADKVFSSLSEQKPAISYSLKEYGKFETALENCPNAIDWLAARGITLAAAKSLHLGFRQTLSGGKEDSKFGWLALPCIEGETVLAIKYRSLTEKVFSKQAGMAKGEQTPLFNSNTIEPLEPVYLVEGEFDCAIMEQAGYHCVSVQSSSIACTAANKEKLLEADYVILAGDNDPCGHEYMNNLWSQMQERTYKLTWPDGMKDANQTFLEFCNRDMLAFKHLVDELTGKAKSNLMPGVSNLRETLKQAQRIDIVDSPFRWHWPWPNMDSMANIMPGNVVYLSSTNTSMGKTTLMMNASLHNARARGMVILNYSAELSDQEYAEVSVSHLLRKDRHTLTPEDYKDKAYAMLAGTRYYIGRDNDLNKINDVLDLMEAAIRRSGAGAVILDTIHFVTTNETDPIRSQENAMNRIKSMAQKYGVIWFNLGQPRKANQQNKGKATHITDAKGSEMLISASDAAFAMHRDCARVDDPNKPPKEPYEPLTQIFLQKGRSLGTGAAYTELMFNGDICTFFPVTKMEQDSKLFTGE